MLSTIRITAMTLGSVAADSWKSTCRLSILEDRVFTALNRAISQRDDLFVHMT